MNTNQVRVILNIIFMIGAVAAVITYYAVEDKHVFLYVSSAAIFVKIIEFILRFMRL